MKCPKCGYTSFDHLDSCKKCGKDLVEFKERFGITSVLFPGQMNSAAAVEDHYDTAVADAAVVAATAPAAMAAETAEEEDVTSKAPEGDDFGFDFMGDSAEDDDLSFDELFEEAPDDEDIEETIEGPKDQPIEDSETTAIEEAFTFDLPEDEADLDDDFGFDPTDEEAGFSFADDELDGSAKGSEEDPKSPFDLPESPALKGAPVTAETSTDADALAITGAMAEADDSDADHDPEQHVYFDFQEAENDIEAAVSEQQQLPIEELESGIPQGVSAPLEIEEEDPEPVVSGHFNDDSRSVPLGQSVAIPPRIGACLCDLILLCIVGGSFIVVAESAMSVGSVRVFPTLETLIDLSVPYFLVMFSLAFGYFTLFHFLAGQTPGKMLAGVRVETAEGHPLTFGHAFLRSVGGLLQLLPLGIGYLVLLFSAGGRGWNDRLAGTRLVNLKGLQEGG